MEGFDPRTSFGYDESKRYDAVDTRGDEEQTVAFLAQLAGQRDVLEFAVGTGRSALPLVKAGVRVDGIQLSQDMVDPMREKPDGNNVKVTMGDMSRVTTGRTYGLVYLVYVPTAPSRPGHQYVDAEHIGVDHVVLDVCRYDPVTQVQAPPGQRAAWPAADRRRHHRQRQRHRRVRGAVGRRARGAHGVGAAAPPARQGRRRQGLRQRRQPCLPARRGLVLQPHLQRHGDRSSGRSSELRRCLVVYRPARLGRVTCRL